jgi:hypothetical protein
MKIVKSTAVFLAAFFLTGFCYGQVRPSGSFFMYDRNLSPYALGLELDKMKDIGMDKVIPLSAGHLNGSAGTPGGSCSALSSDGLLYPSLLVAIPPADDRLGTLLTLADQRGMKVYIGSLQTAGNWTTGDEFDALRSCNKAVAEEIFKRYGSHPSLLGFYWTQEIWLNWVKHYGSGYYGITLLNQFVSDVQSVAPGKIVLAAPVFKQQGSGDMPGLTPADAQAAMNLLLSGSGLKLVAPQDGIGALAGAPSLSGVGGYYSAMLSAAQLNGTQLWSTLETFVNNGGDKDRYPSAPISRITQQISAEQSFVSGMITWIFGHDMSPQATYYPVAASQLYLDYKSFYSGSLRPVKLPFTYRYNVSAIHDEGGTPNLAHPDTQFTKLTDGLGGGFGGNGTDWVGCLDTEDNNHCHAYIDLGQVRHVTRVRILFCSELASWIEFPQVVQLIGKVTDWSNWSDANIYEYTQWNDTVPNNQIFSVGWMDMEIPSGMDVRYLDVYAVHLGWLFIAELEVYGN